MTAVTLRPHEAGRLADHGDVLIVRPVKLSDENTRGCGPGLALLRGHHATWLREGIGLTWVPFAGSPEVPMPPNKVAEYSPFGPIGGECWGREAWALGTGYGKGFGINIQVRSKPWCYEVDPSRRFEAISLAGSNGWGKSRSAVTMPRWASRFPRLVVASVECRRIQSVTEDDAIRTGLAPAPYEKEVGGYSAEHVEAMCRDCIKRSGPDEWLANGYYWFAALRKGE